MNCLDPKEEEDRRDRFRVCVVLYDQHIKKIKSASCRCLGMLNSGDARKRSN